jgi:hypothetical protein
MKISPLQLLKELHLYHSKNRYPNVPEYGRVSPRYSDKTANGLTRCIIDFINFKGGQAERISNTGRPIDRRQTYTDAAGFTRTIGSIEWIKGSGKNGTADISATIRGRSVKIEVKIGRDKQSNEQIKYQRQVEDAGGFYVIAKDFGGFYNWYKNQFESNGG